MVSLVVLLSCGTVIWWCFLLVLAAKWCPKRHKRACLTPTETTSTTASPQHARSTKPVRWVELILLVVLRTLVVTKTETQTDTPHARKHTQRWVLFDGVGFWCVCGLRRMLVLTLVAPSHECRTHSHIQKRIVKVIAQRKNLEVHEE
jgi:hypothetical protein